MGQEIGVTPLQMVSAVATLANGGVMMKPYVVSEVRDQKGHLQKEMLPQVKRRAVSPETARTLTTILEGVVTNGTGTKAAIPGFRVAGKTGTAQKIDPRTGTYSSNQFVGSFVGFVPADAPRLAMIIVIDEPQGEALGGSSRRCFDGSVSSCSMYLGVPSEDQVKIAFGDEGQLDASWNAKVYDHACLPRFCGGRGPGTARRPSSYCAAITDDSRTISPGSLFVAVKR